MNGNSGPKLNHMIVALITFAPAKREKNANIQIVIPFKFSHTVGYIVGFIG